MKKILSKINIFKQTFTELDFSKLIKYHYFKLIVIFIITLFSFIIYLSLPAFFNYENFDKYIENKFNKDFKISIKNIKGISYSFIPSPHFIIEESYLSLNLKENQKDLLNVKNLKIYIHLKNLFNKQTISIKKIVLRNNNFYLQNIHFKDFTEHLSYNNNKPIHIYNSKFFYVDKNKKISSISQIKELNYFIDKKKQKYLNIKGKLFDSNFKYLWKKDQLKSNISYSTINLKNPNIKIFNEHKKTNDKDETFSKVNFLNNKLKLNFLKEKNKIIFKTVKNNIDLPDKIGLSGNVDLQPFFFSTIIVLSKSKINFILDKLLYYLYTYNNLINPNFNGKLSVNFLDLNSKLFQDLIINFEFSEKKIKIFSSNLSLKKIGKIYFSDINYIDIDGEILLETKMKLDISDQKEFYRRFQISKKNRIILKTIDFVLKKNITDNYYSISNVSFNDKNNTSLDDSEIYEKEEKKFNNIHQLTKIIRDEFK